VREGGGDRVSQIDRETEKKKEGEKEEGERESYTASLSADPKLKSFR
jgi:hypothetical protein